MREEVNFCARCNDRLPPSALSPCCRCRNDPFPQNTVLRRAGFTIALRPKRGPNLWAHGKEVFTEAVAIRLIGKREKPVKVLMAADGTY